LADNLAECYEPENSYLLTIMTDPPDVGEIKLNTLNHTSLPWSGTYYDNMNQLISTKRTNDAYEFSHWSSKGSKITIADSSLLSTKIELFGRDTLVANYKSPLSAQGIDKNAITAIYPNPTNSILNVKLQNSGIEKELSYSILNVSGRTVLSKKLDLIPNGNNFTISLSELDIAEGVYFLKITSNQRSSINKFTFIK
ncbi:MAG: T9SS type A sorting domain-containing protein, partial [Saprospiraceae bacterium]